MIELKTLKDFDTLIIEKGMDNVPSKVIQAFKRDLKQEAIKHAKKDQRLAMKSKIIDVDNFNFLLGRISFAKEFLNLKEEDLK